MKANEATDKTFRLFCEKSLSAADERDSKLPNEEQHYRDEVKQLLREAVGDNEESFKASMALVENVMPTIRKPAEPEWAKLISDSGLEQEVWFESRWGDPEKAAEMLRQLSADEIRRERSNLENRLFLYLTREGEIWFGNFRFGRALEPFEKAIALRPSSTEARMNVGKTLLFVREGDQAGQWRRAFDILGNSIDRSDPLWPEYELWRGCAYYKAPQLAWHEKLSNAEKAFRNALEGFDKASRKVKWATVANNLGIVLFQTGDEERQKEAQGFFRKSLEIWSEESHPYQWGLANKHLGNCLYNRNPDKALGHYEAALRVYAADDFPAEWAQLKYTIGNLWIAKAKLSRGRPATKFCNMARSLCDEAISRLTPDNLLDWANAHFNLAESYDKRPKPTDDDLEHAIKSYLVATNGYREISATEWSETHFPLAAVYEELAKRRKDVTLLALAISSVKACCSIRDQDFGKVPVYKAKLEKLRALYEKQRGVRNPSFAKIPRAR